MAISPRQTTSTSLPAAPRRENEGVQEAAVGVALSGHFAPGGLLNWDQIVSNYGLTKGQLAETVGLRTDTLQKAARRDAPKTQARVTEMLEILNLLEAWAGGRRQALAWYRSQPIAALDGRTAEALVKSGKAGAVRDYIDHIAMGGFA